MALMNKEAQRFIASQDGDIELAFLPDYAPESSPDEKAWSHLKARLGKSPIMNQYDMKCHVLWPLHPTQKNPVDPELLPPA